MFDFRQLKAAWANFVAEARARARATTQPTLAPLEHMSEEVKAVLASALRGSFDEGVAAEKARFAAFFESEEYKKPLAAVVRAAFNDGVLHEKARAAAALEHATVDHPTESHAPESATLH
jgi:hypothetical protein